MKTLWILAAFAAPMTVTATPIVYDFTGTVYLATGTYSAVPVGATVSGTYAIDLANDNPAQSVLPVSLSSNWSSVNNNGADFGLPSNDNYVFASSANVAGVSYVTATPGTTGSQSAVEGTAYGSISAGEYIALEANFGASNPESSFQLLNSKGDPFSIAGLPVFAGATGLGFFTSDLPSGVVDYSITSITPVPLPAAAWLLLSAVGAVSGMSRPGARASRCRSQG